MPKLVNILGRRFGMLTVVARVGGSKTSLWRVRCDCGVVKETSSQGLRRGRTRSCGCATLDFLREGSTVHGMHKADENRIWVAMKQRCTNKHNVSYHKYGGRGIRVCPRWMHSFENFYKDVGPRPSKQHSLDRIDNEDDYTPENCRWATAEMQANNTRHNRRITFSGKTLTVAQWARALGINESTLRVRLHRGWSTDRALST